MTTRTELRRSIKRGLEALFADTSVSQSTTREELEELVEDIQVMIEALRG